MIKPLVIILMFALAGCSAVPQGVHAPSPCSSSEAAYACQIERYQNVNVD
jgi:starvation-inducible outer membrane lipoprotein